MPPGSKTPLKILDHGPESRGLSVRGPYLERAQRRLDSLCRMVQGCHACPAMEGRKRVLSAANGRAGVEVMFIAEAPGRNGADRTGVPLHGDPSGNMFERLLKEAGWTRDQVFVTNAVLCNPRTDAETNRPPSQLELENCSHHLEEQILYVNPLVIVTLGAAPLSALALIRPHKYTLANAGSAWDWGWFKLFPLYHPSPKAMFHRTFGKMAEDFKRLAGMVKSLART